MHLEQQRTHTLKFGIAACGVLVLGLCLPTPAHAGEFLDTRVTFTMGDDNFLKNAGEQVPDSPRLGIGDRPGYEFPSDNLNLATTGRENELHLVLYKRMEGILPGLTTEAAAAIELNMFEMVQDSPSLKRVLKDDSSYIRLSYAIDKDKKGDKYIDLVLFPLSGDRFRVGYLYDLTWGGSNSFTRKKGPTPAFKLGGNHGLVSWWAGMKMVLAERAPQITANDQGTKRRTTDYETMYSALAGVGIRPIEGLHFDVSGGYIQQAWNPVEEENVKGTLVTATGFSARLAYSRGLPVSLSSDLQLLRNDPEYYETFSMKPKYDPNGGVSWRVSAEGNAIAQVLADADSYGATTTQWAWAAALEFRMQVKYFRINVTGVARSLAFNLLNSPSFPSYMAFPNGTIEMPQVFAAISADYHFAGPALTPSLQVGFELPAAMKTRLYARSAGSNAPGTLIGEHTLLFPNAYDQVILPEGASRKASVRTRLALRWFASDMLTLLGYVMLVYDQNITILTLNPDLTRSRVFDDPVRFGAGITAQARF